MPTSITSGSATFDITTSDFYFMGENEVLIKNGLGAAIDIDAANVDLFVNGQIYSDEFAIITQFGRSDLNLTIGEDAILVSSDATVSIVSADSSAVNFGSLTSLQDVGMLLGQLNTTFLNYGSVFGREAGLQLSSNLQYAVNHDTISGGVGVKLAGIAANFVNYGTITGSANDGDNDGYGIEITNSASASVIRNFGTVTGDTVSIFSEDGASNLLIRNIGTLVGDVDLGNGNDTYVAGANGTVVGRILTDEGDDTVIGGHQTDDIHGGDDNDRLFGRGGDDLVYGGFGNDTVWGGTGDDLLDGAIGRDDLSGGAGNDFIFGGQAVDILRGGNGDDMLDGGGGIDDLRGGNGDDILFGGTGADILRGGRGDDELTGGTGNDVFVFHANGGRDTITDFTNGQDVINLRSFGEFSFASLTANFTVDLHGPNGSFIDFGNGDVLVLENMTFGNLDESDFIF